MADDRGGQLPIDDEGAAAALDAWREGEAAVAMGERLAARRWFDRAHRLAPKQDRITLSLAMVLLNEGDPEAGGLLRGVAERHDLKPVWLALAAAEQRAGERGRAAEALTRALSGHSWTRAEAAAASMLDRIAGEAGWAGWCALTAKGRLLTRRLTGDRGGAGLEIALDGRAIGAGPHLPAGWERAWRMDVMDRGRPLLGSPIRVGLLRRTEGFVECRAGGIGGWVWHPGEPETPPVIGIGPAGTRAPAFRIRAREEGVHRPEAAPLARLRAFFISAERLRGITGAISVRDRDGNELAGSPLEPGLEAAAAAALAQAVARTATGLQSGPTKRRGWRGWDAAATRVAVRLAGMPVGTPGESVPARARRVAGRWTAAPAVDVIVPVHGGMAVTLDCLEIVGRHLPQRGRIVVVDDASPEPELKQALTAMGEAGRIELVRHERAAGFPGACNAGIGAARPGADVVLLNSDTRVVEGWIEGLQAAALSSRDIGTATPFSNDATILSYPDPLARNPAPDAAEATRLARLARRMFAGRAVEIPTGVGFCLYLRRACVEEVGAFRQDLFAQGYGEENDFCIRARHLGWRHVAAPGVFVAHVGGQSFGAVGPELMRRNLRMLNRLHPGYDDLIAAYGAADPLFPFRRRLDAARFGAGRRRGAVLFITHARGGGVARLVGERAEAVLGQGLRPIVIRPAEGGFGRREVLVGEAGGEAFPNLRYTIPEELGALARLLRAERVEHCEVHHLVGHDHAILGLCRRLDLAYDAYVHDYASFCGRIALVGTEPRYCGEPALEVCAACIADAGSEIEEEIAPADLVHRSEAELGAARRVIAPSADAALRMERHFPGLAVGVVPWERDGLLPEIAPRVFGRPRRVGVIGAIGTAKGYEMLLAVARDAAWRDLPLEFVLIGYSRDDKRLAATGRVFVTGAYREEELAGLISRERVDFAFLPSVWPETWCFAVSEAWRAGLAVAAFDLGAPAARIRATGRGWILPLGLSASAINNTLLAVNPLAHQ